MQVLLDTIVSSFLLTLLLILAVGSACVIGSLAKPFKSGLLNWLYSGALMGIFGLLFFFHGLLNPYFFGFGYVRKMEKIALHERYICFADYLVAGGSDGDIGTEHFRLHILDRQTGKRLYRTMLGADVNHFEQQNGVLMYGDYRHLALLDIATGKVKDVFDKETLPARFPALRMGIDKLQYSPADSCMEVSAKDGKRYYLYPYTQKLVEKAPEYRPPPSYARFEMQPKEHGSKIMTLKGKGAYIEGKILHIFGRQEAPFYVILHYTSTDKTAFILSCVDTQAKTRWEIQQASLQASDWLTENPTFGVFGVSGHLLVCSVGGFVYAIHAETGEKIWENRL